MAFRLRTVWLALLACFSAGAFLTPATPFSIDEVLYIDMAEAMAKHGRLTTTPEALPESAPVITKSVGLMQVIDGNAVPQYPGGYALLAAPFFALFGVSGLVLMNALAAVMCLWLTWRLGLALYDDRWIAGAAALLLGCASYFSGYVFAIWPHLIVLAMTLGAALLCVDASQDVRQSRVLKTFFAGLLLGLAVTIRVDAIVPAFAVVLWLRLFACPKDRVSAIALIAGLAPGLWLAAALNDAKFDVFLPFFYGEKDGLDSVSRYTAIGLLGAVVMAGAFLFDASHRRYSALQRHAGLLTASAVAAAGLFLAVFQNGFFLRLVNGIYFLVADIQAHDPADIRHGVFKDAHGYWSFWDLPKKALLQSLPFMALLAIPVIAFFQNKNRNTHALSLLMIVGVISFFSMNAWHGGMTFNMRYFLPALPFIALMSADGLSRFRPVMKSHPNLMLRGVIGGAAAALFFYFLAPDMSPSLATPSQLYPQLVLFALLLVAVTIYCLKRTSRFAVTMLSGAAIGYAAFLGAADAAGDMGLRAAKAPYDNAYAAFPDDALVLTTAEDHLIKASLNGVVVARPQAGNAAQAVKLAALFEAANRCVYVLTPEAMAVINGARFRPVSVPGLAEVTDDPLQLYALESQLEFCWPNDR